VLAALAAGQVSESVARAICLWTDKLPQEHRDAGDEHLLAAASGGLGIADLAALFAEMYVRARGDLPDQDPACPEPSTTQSAGSVCQQGQACAHG
jgi:hypothetical protein